MKGEKGLEVAGERVAQLATLTLSVRRVQVGIIYSSVCTGDGGAEKIAIKTRKCSSAPQLVS